MKNMKFGTRLITSMVITLVLMIVLTAVSIWSTGSVRSGYEEILSGAVAITDAVQTSSEEVNSIARQIRDMALSGYDAAQVAEIEAAEAEIETALATIEKLYSGTDGLDEAYVNAVRNWESTFADICAALEAGDLEQARQLIQTQCTPRLETAVAQGDELKQQVQQNGNEQNCPGPRCHDRPAGGGLRDQHPDESENDTQHGKAAEAGGGGCGGIQPRRFVLRCGLRC